MDDVDCRGFEGSLTDCQYHENSDCTHAEDAGVICGVKRGDQLIQRKYVWNANIGVMNGKRARCLNLDCIQIIELKRSL